MQPPRGGVASNCRLDDRVLGPASELPTGHFEPLHTPVDRLHRPELLNDPRWMHGPRPDLGEPPSPPLIERGSVGIGRQWIGQLDAGLWRFLLLSDVQALALCAEVRPQAGWTGPFLVVRGSTTVLNLHTSEIDDEVRGSLLSGLSTATPVTSAARMFLVTGELPDKHTRPWTD